jgi:2-hydroxy-6-oxonona-2,4-dienedioate hydrolase
VTAQLAFTQIGLGPTMLLLHGGTGSRTHWERNIDELAVHFAVLAPDLPGTGKSPDVPPGLSASEYAQLVHHELDRLIGQQPLHLVGFSFGAVLAANFAARRGDQVRALTLLGPGGFGRPVGRVLPLRPLPAAGEDRRHAAAHNLGQVMLAEAPAADDPAVDIALANIAASRFDSRIVSLSETLLKDLHAATAPVQIIWGAEDRLAHPSVAARAQACRDARPDARVHIIPRAGHWVQYDAAPAVNDHIIQFHSAQHSGRSLT